MHDLNAPYEDIREEAPTLYALAGRHGFRVPDGYFEQLPQLVLDQLEAEDELLHEEAPTLFAKRIGDGFDVPAGYFDALPSALEARIALEHGNPERLPDVPEGFFAQMEQDILAQTVEAEPQAQPARVVRFKPWMAWSSGVAAAVVIALFTLLPAQQAQCETFACLWEDTATEEALESLDETSLYLLLEDDVPAMGTINEQDIDTYLFEEVEEEPFDNTSLDALLDDADLDDLLDELDDELYLDY